MYFDVLRSLALNRHVLYETCYIILICLWNSNYIRPNSLYSVVCVALDVHLYSLSYWGEKNSETLCPHFAKRHVCITDAKDSKSNESRGLQTYPGGNVEVKYPRWFASVLMKYLYAYRHMLSRVQSATVLQMKLYLLLPNILVLYFISYIFLILRIPRCVVLESWKSTFLIDTIFLAGYKLNKLYNKLYNKLI